MTFQNKSYTIIKVLIYKLELSLARIQSWQSNVIGYSVHGVANDFQSFVS